MIRAVRMLHTSVLVAVLSTGCSSRRDSPTPDASVPERTIATPAKPRLTIDGHRAQLLSLTETSLPLQHFLPGDKKDPAGWRAVRVQGSKGRELTLVEPAKTYPRADVRVRRTATGDVELGVFRHIPADLPKDARAIAERPAVDIAGVLTIDVVTEVAPAPPPPIISTIELEISGKSHTVTRDSLGKLPTLPGRGDGAEWLLVDVLRPYVGLETIRRVRAKNSAGEITLEGADIRDAKKKFSLRWGRRGHVRLRSSARDRELPAGGDMKLTIETKN